MAEGFPFLLAQIATAFLGAVVGSFLNVVVYRLPRGLSIVRPRSFCPACQRPIPWFRNVPLLSFLLQRGRAACCGAAISWRYPLIEAATAALFLACLRRVAAHAIVPIGLGGYAAAGLLCLLVALLVAITFIDAEHFLIPDVLSLPAIPIGIATAYFFGPALGVSVRGSLVGFVAGAGTLLVVLQVYAMVTGRAGLGGGDYKLMGLIGAWLGAASLPFTLLAASVQGLLWAVAAKGLKLFPEGGSFRHAAVPFGPFLALAAVEWLLFQDQLRPLVLPYDLA